MEGKHVPKEEEKGLEMIKAAGLTGHVDSCRFLSTFLSSTVHCSLLPTFSLLPQNVSPLLASSLSFSFSFS